jgi:SNF2 family DNA or RNA helicase
VIKPWKHQIEEAEMIRRGMFVYIAAGMGTGKSIATLLGLMEQRRVLIVCPLAVGRAWVKQIGIADAGRAAVLLTEGPTARRAETLRAVQADSRHAVILNYDAVSRDTALAKAVMAMPWDAIVLDESHRIKSPSGKTSKFFSKLAKQNPSAKRVCLSGTPTPHDPLDWWSQFRFLDPTVLGESFPAFRERIAVLNYYGWVKGFKQDALKSLAKRIDPHIYRVDVDDVLDLPGETHTAIPISLPRKAAAFYAEIEAEMIAMVETGEVVTAANKLVVVTRLQQATSGFGVDDRGEIVPVCDRNAKCDALQDLLQDLKEPVVVFCKFVHDLDNVAAVCKRLGASSSELSGRKKELERWQAGETDVLVVQQQSGGCGIDLTRSSAAVYFSLSHSLGDYEQSLARLRRPGQTRTVRYWHLVAEDTVDEAIYAALDRKRDVTEEVIQRLTRRVNNARRK